MTIRQGFSTCQAFSVFTPLAVPGDPILGPNEKNAALMGTHENQQQLDTVFSTCPRFSVFIPLAIPWDPIGDPNGKSYVLMGLHTIQ